MVCYPNVSTCSVFKPFIDLSHQNGVLIECFLCCHVTISYSPMGIWQLSAEGVGLLIALGQGSTKWSLLKWARAMLYQAPTPCK